MSTTEFCLSLIVVELGFIVGLLIFISGKLS